MFEPESAHAGRAARKPSQGGSLRVLGVSIDRLHLQLATGVSLIVIGFLGIGFWAFSTQYYNASLAAQQRAAELQARMLEAALRHAMLEEDSELITSVLLSVSADSSVRGAMILDHDGTIRHASDPAALGEVIPQESAECMVCHAVDAAERGRWTLIRREGETLLRSVLPIENRAECHLCHDTGEKFNGMLVMDTSMAELEAMLGAETGWFVIGVAAMSLLLLGTISVFMRRLILNRLARLGHAARSIAAGNLRDRVQLRGKDVITSLGADFNDMADNVTRLVDEVRAQQAQLQEVMNSLDDGLVVLDEESRVIACNRSFGRRIGRIPETVQGLRCYECCSGVLPCCASGTSVGSECPASRCRETGLVHRAVFGATEDDGEVRSIEEVLASPILDDEGRVVRVVEIWRDITERVKEEESLAEIERMVSLGALASGFSHEVNTPLATVLTCAEAVIGRIDEVPAAAGPPSALAPIREHAVIIRDQILRCRRITEQFLRFSRGIPPSVEPIELPRVVSGVIDLVAPTAREGGITLEHSCDGALPAVRANSEVVQHVVLNLLINAVQSFQDGGGRVEVSYRVDEAVRLLVRDEGSGIDPERRAHLFEPFRSRKPGGTGLGLFLSRSFMRRFGGDVRLVESRVGFGTCFEVVFAAVGVEE